MKNCKDCHGPCNSQATRCAKCHGKYLSGLFKRPEPTCQDCGIIVSHGCKRCRPCHFKAIQTPRSAKVCTGCGGKCAAGSTRCRGCYKVPRRVNYAKRPRPVPVSSAQRHDLMCLGAYAKSMAIVVESLVTFLDEGVAV